MAIIIHTAYGEVPAKEITGTTIVTKPVTTKHGIVNYYDIEVKTSEGSWPLTGQGALTKDLAKLYDRELGRVIEAHQSLEVKPCSVKMLSTYGFLTEE